MSNGMTVPSKNKIAVVAGRSAWRISEFVKHVGVRTCDVGDSIVTEHQPFEHRLVNGATDLFLVCSDRLKAGLFDSRRDDLAIYGIEIDQAPSRVGLAAKWHEHETEWRIWF